VHGKGFESQFTSMARIDEVEMHASAQQYNGELTELRVIKIKITGIYREKSSGIF
jgi:hypothetical protein